MVTLDGVPVSGSPIEVIIGKPSISPVGSTPPGTSARSVRRSSRKPGEIWDVHGIAICKEGQIVATDTNCHRVQVYNCKSYIEAGTMWQTYCFWLQY